MNPADQLTQALADRIGLRPEISRPKVLDLLQKRSTQHADTWVPGLLEAGSSSREWLDFIEPFLIHETYFFRHASQLEFLAERVIPALLEERGRQGRHVFRVWCAACSSGEEAYSIGLLLRDAITRHSQVNGHLKDPQQWQVQIIGTDLSHGTIQRARTGEYHASSGLNSFRDIPAFARHHFPPLTEAPGSTWTADEQLRKSVSFLQSNLIKDAAPSHDLDLILCRNILIYFEEPKIRLVLSKFREALRPGGALLLGPADSFHDPSAFDCVTNDRVMVWKKKGAAAP